MKDRASKLAVAVALVGAAVVACVSHSVAASRTCSQDKGAQLTGNVGDSDRARIMAALDANGCQQQVTIIRSSQPDDDDVPQAQSIDNEATDNGLRQPEAQDQTLDNGVIIRRSGNGFLPLGGEYRTLCVRTCDGYFFPMSTATSVGDFQRDQSRCAVACPGTEIEMFYAEGSNAKPADMTSAITGRPYAELRNAFVYKRLDIAREPGCSCGVSQDSSVVGDPQAIQPPRISSRPGSSIVEIRPAEPTSSTSAGRGVESEPVAREPDEDRKVRVVGPRFLPDPEAAIDPQAPARKRAR